MSTWTVPGRVTRVIDGDTLVADLDLGWGVWRVGTHIRLAGINCPEMSVPAGQDARQYVIDRLHPWGPAVEAAGITVVSHSLDKYGRVLADVYWWDQHNSSGVTPPLADQNHLNADLLAAGHAVEMR